MLTATPALVIFDIDYVLYNQKYDWEEKGLEVPGTHQNSQAIGRQASGQGDFWREWKTLYLSFSLLPQALCKV